jgi:activator of HSP90 ATPase
MKTSFEIEQSFEVMPHEIFSAWLSSEQHAAMTGGEAQCSIIEGESFSAWDGYISGTNLKLIANSEIHQTWRTTEFQDSDPDSNVVIKFSETTQGCRLNLSHTNIPEGQSDYKKGWIDHYFNPMMAYFSRSLN